MVILSPSFHDTICIFQIFNQDNLLDGVADNELPLYIFVTDLEKVRDWSRCLLDEWLNTSKIL